MLVEARRPADSGPGARTSATRENERQAATALRAAVFFGFRSANSKPTLPLSNLRCAENGRPFLETNLGSKSVLPVLINFCTCSFGMSRCKIFLLMRKVQVFSFETAFSHA